jgi:hypothetical protein
MYHDFLVPDRIRVISSRLTHSLSNQRGRDNHFSAVGRLDAAKARSCMIKSRLYTTSTARSLTKKASKKKKKKKKKKKLARGVVSVLWPRVL